MDAGFQKSSSKFPNKFPAQPYQGFRYQLTKYQFFQIYYYYYIIIIIIITIIIIIIIIIIIVSAKILERCGTVGL